MPVISILDATFCDIEAIQAIYQLFIDNQYLALDTQVPSPQEWEQKITTLQESHAFLVIKLDQEIIGFVYAYPFSARKAYQHSANLAMYFHPEHEDNSSKALILQELEKRLKTKGIHHLITCLPANYQSHIQFLVSQAFILRGQFPQGVKRNDQLLDLVWLSKEI